MRTLYFNGRRLRSWGFGFFLSCVDGVTSLLDSLTGEAEENRRRNARARGLLAKKKKIRECAHAAHSQIGCAKADGRRR